MKKLKNTFLFIVLLGFMILFSSGISIYYHIISSCSYLAQYNNDDLMTLLDNKNRKIFTLTNSIGKCHIKKYTPFLISALDSNFYKESLSIENIKIKELANISLNKLYDKNYRFSPSYSLDTEQTDETITIWKTLYSTGQLK